MAATNPGIIAALAGYGVFLWLGLYLLVRGGVRSPLIRVAITALLLQSLFFFAAAWRSGAADPTGEMLLERWTWWTAVLPLAVWFHLSSLLARGITRPTANDHFVPGRAVVAYVAALVLIALGTATNLFNDYRTSAVGVRPGPAYSVYMLFQATMTIGALFHFVRARAALGQHTAQLERQLGLLIGGSVPFALGGLWLGLRFLLGLPVPELPGFLLLFAAIVPLGYGVAHFGMLVGGQNVQRDFLYTFTGIALLNVVYSLLLVLTTGISVGGLLALVTLVTLTHTAFDNGRSWLDRLFFTSDEQQARAEARDFATALGSAPVASLGPEPADPEPVQQPADQHEAETLPDESTKRSRTTFAKP